ncbi:type II toxin-antitoxin system PemK/MazF family toxin [Myxococcota bacterium]
MKRGDLYRVHKGSREDPKSHRVFVVVGRQSAIDSQYSTVICAPVYSAFHGLATQVEVDQRHGLKRASCVHCDGLISIPKAKLKDFVGHLDSESLRQVGDALAVALGLK